MDSREKTPCLSFVDLLRNFLGNKKSRKLCRFSYSNVKAFCDLVCEMSRKLHFISSYLDHETGQDNC